MLTIAGAELRRAPLTVLRRIDLLTCRLLELDIDGVLCCYLNDPRLIAAVLETHWPQFRKEFGYKKSRDLIADDLFSPRLIWPNAKEFADLASSLEAVLASYVAQVNQQVPDLYRWCRQLTIEIFRQTLLEGLIRPRVTNEELEEATLSVIRDLGQVILKFPYNIDLDDEVDVATRERFYAYAQLFQAHPKCAHATPGRAITTLLAGYEQMASVMYWLIVHYAERPLGSNHVNKRCFIDEVIRLHSPIWTIMRRPKKNVRLGEFVLKKGCVVITSPWLMARNPVYFPNPEQFDAARWENRTEKFAFFPFSHGPRVCKAERFVRTTLASLLAELENRKVTVSPGGFGEEHHNVQVSATPLRKRSATFA